LYSERFVTGTRGRTPRISLIMINNSWNYNKEMADEKNQQTKDRNDQKHKEEEYKKLE
jgi:hypothetical protein